MARVWALAICPNICLMRAGFIVVAYELDGDVSDRNDPAQIEAGTRAYVRANAGIYNGMTAISFALSSMPRVDRTRLYVAGHSSAATVALLMAQHDPRVAACAAYAPTTDIPARLGERSLDFYEEQMPGFSRFVTRYSPLTNAARLRCPTFLFHADDDSNTPLADNVRFARAVRSVNPHLQFVRVPTGNHYDSMIRQGIPLAIRWLQSRPELRTK